MKQTPIALLPRREVERLTGYARSSLYSMIERGLFPRPVRIAAGDGPGSVRWVQSEVEAWIQARIAERDSKAA